MSLPKRCSEADPCSTRNLRFNIYLSYRKCLVYFVWKNITYYVYILASERNGTLYIGVTNDLLVESKNIKMR